MAQIGFTAKTEPVYIRFQDMRRAYEDAHGRTYAPGFLTVLMDAFEVINQLDAAREGWVKDYPKTADRFVLEVTENGIKIYQVHPDREGDEWIEIEKIKPVSLRAYIADAEANDPELQQVVIKDDNCSYITDSTTAAANFSLTDHKEKAMIFDNRDQAATFLRKCGHEVGNWIIEPA